MDTYFTSGMSIYPDTALGASVAPGASDAYGSYVELAASTASDIMVCYIVASAGDAQHLRLQIATGGAGSESVKATIAIKPIGNITSGIVPFSPLLLIPSGSRIAVRIASTNATPTSIRINMCYVPIASVINPVLSEVSNLTGAVVADGANSATTFKTNLTQSINNYWKDCFLKFTSGNLINQVKKITAYNGTTKFVTVNAFTGIPSASDTVEIINK